MRAYLDAGKLAEDPVRDRLATLSAFHIIGLFPGLVRKENLERYEEVEAELGGE